MRLLVEDRKIFANSFPIDSAGCELVHTIICVAHRRAPPLFTTPQWLCRLQWFVCTAGIPKAFGATAHLSDGSEIGLVYFISVPRSRQQRR